MGEHVKLTAEDMIVRETISRLRHERTLRRRREEYYQRLARYRAAISGCSAFKEPT